MALIALLVPGRRVSVGFPCPKIRGHTEVWPLIGSSNVFAKHGHCTPEGRVHSKFSAAVTPCPYDPRAASRGK
jgi:hypothetical protein